jgi:N-acylneuraminate cytidylyltransferase|tara:strand:- start:2290 stop:2997 length:708 start_codon:yes stop_codon:yes gene_type:complete
MNIVALIPARGGSKGIKNKNIINILGKPLISHTIISAKKIKQIDEIYVSTDSPKIKKISEKFGAKVPFLRPKKYSTDNSEDLEVFKHFYKWYLKKEKKKIDLIIHLRATSPFRKVEIINKAINIIKRDINVSSLRSFQRSPFSPFKMWERKNNLATPFVNKKINGKEAHSQGRQLLPDVFCHTPYIDIIKPDLTINRGSMVGEKTYFFLIDKKNDRFIDIDTKDDLIRLKKSIYK